MIAAGTIHPQVPKDGRDEQAIWYFEDKISVTNYAGETVLTLTEKEMRQVLSAYCESTPKLNEGSTTR